jgi:hypothetical protein
MAAKVREKLIHFVISNRGTREKSCCSCKVRHFAYWLCKPNKISPRYRSFDMTKWVLPRVFLHHIIHYLRGFVGKVYVDAGLVGQPGVDVGFEVVGNGAYHLYAQFGC